jgi:hypothetical protein
VRLLVSYFSTFFPISLPRGPFPSPCDVPFVILITLDEGRPTGVIAAQCVMIVGKVSRKRLEGYLLVGVPRVVTPGK